MPRLKCLQCRASYPLGEIHHCGIKGELYPGEELIQEAIQAHRERPDYDVDLQVGDVALPRFFVRNGVIQPDTMVGKPFAEWIWRRRHLYRGKHVTDGMFGLVGIFDVRTSWIWAAAGMLLVLALIFLLVAQTYKRQSSSE